MKKILILFFLVLLAFAQADAKEFVFYSTKTSSAAVTTGTGYYHGYKVTTDGTNACTVVVYDSTAESGTVIDQSTVWPTSSTLRAGSSSYSPPRPYYTGLYVSITVGGGGSCTVSVDFEPSK